MTKILAPTLPFQTAIRIHEGKMIVIKGKVPYGAQRIEINLMTGFDMTADRALHLGIRFDQQCVVRNHKQYDQWGHEERHGAFPFTFGREFKLLIAVNRTQYGIAVNNQHCWNFGHRLPVEQVNSIAMRGFCDIKEIEFIDRTTPTAESVQRPHSARTRLPPVYNPNIPYAYPIYDGLEPGMTMYINGRPSSYPAKFSLSVQKGEEQYPPPDVAFRFDARFFNRSVARGIRYNGLWATEETYISHFPFEPGISFEMVIRVDEDKFSVSINGRHFTDFRHRLRPLEQFDTLSIEHDVSISSIRFS